MGSSGDGYSGETRICAVLLGKDARLQRRSALANEEIQMFLWPHLAKEARNRLRIGWLNQRRDFRDAKWVGVGQGEKPPGEFVQNLRHAILLSHQTQRRQRTVEYLISFDGR